MTDRTKAHRKLTHAIRYLRRDLKRVISRGHVDQTMALLDAYRILRRARAKCRPFAGGKPRDKLMQAFETDRDTSAGVDRPMEDS